jgi:subtilisin family serine protease
MEDTPGTNVISSNHSCLGTALVAVTFLWILLVTFIWQVDDQLLQVFTATRWMAVGYGVVLIIPPALLSVIWRPARERSIFAAWALAGGYTLLLIPGRLFDPIESQWVLLVQLVMSLVVLVLLSLFRPNRTVSPNTGALLFALASPALVLYPWLFWGALGSLLDTLLAIALGLVVGINAGLIIGNTWLSGLDEHSHGRGWDIFTGGMVIGGVLTLIAAGLSFNGGSARLILALPGLGWLAMALSYSRPPNEVPQRYSWRPMALLTGIVIAGIIALTDTDTLSLLAQDQLAGTTFLAAVLSMSIGWGLALPALLMSNFWGRPFSPVSGTVVVTVLLWLAGGVIYFLGGHPGFYGDRIFVVLKDQANVSAASEIENYDDRRRFVYTTLTEHANQSQANIHTFLDRLGINYTSYYLANAVEVEGGLVTRLLLMTRPEVDRILYSPRLRPVKNLASADGSAAPPTRPQWNLTNIGVDRVWNELGIQGQGIVIGQADSGVQWDHPELIDSYRGNAGDHNYHWFDPWLNTLEPQDFSGHGTHTLGSIVGNSVGVAPEAEWFACSNLTRNVGNPALYLDCWQFLLAPFPLDSDPFSDGDPTRSAHIINNSWGCPDDSEGCDSTVLLPAVQALRAAGIFVEASAGNDGPACSTVQSPPSTFDEVFSTGAIDINNDVALFSSTGPVVADGSGRIKPDIMAPGVAVLSAFPNNSYAKLDGTSMAGPHVSGVVALMWSANPDLIGDIDRTEQILIDTATPFTGTLAGLDISAMMAELLGEDVAPDLTLDMPEENQAPVDMSACITYTDLDEVPNNIAGYGIVNAYEAVKEALAVVEQ